MCIVFLCLTESGERVGLVCFLLFPVQFLYLWFLLNGYQFVGGHCNQHQQPCVNFIMHTVVLLNVGELLCCCLSLDSPSYQVCLWYPPSSFLFSVIFTLSLPLCVSIFDTLSFFLTLLTVLYQLGLCLSLYLPLSLVLNEG